VNSEEARLIYEHAITLNSIERISYLDQVCMDNPDLRNEVELMIVSHLDTLGFQRTSDQPLRSDRIGAYRIIRKLGEGGMGVVYLAESSDAQATRVAIKIIKRGMDSEAILRRFKQEQRILGSLDHPNIAHLLEAGSTNDGLSYFVMEYVRGEPVVDYCNRQKLTIQDRLKLFATICSAVEYAHEKRVIHRDLKPANILVTGEGRPKLLDFGIAKLLDSGQTTGLTATGDRVMTGDYASPEQISGETLTVRSDIYSLGVVGYEMLTGHRPTPNSEDSLTRSLADIFSVALRKNPEQRYASAESFGRDIENYLNGNTVAARRTMFRLRMRDVLRKKAALGFAAIVIVAVFSLLLFRYVAHAGNHRPADVRAIAVLPFHPIYAAKRDPFLEQGITDALITRLSNLQKIVVRPTVAVQPYVNSTEEPAVIGRNLDVDVVLAGDIQETESQVRVMARLIRVSDGSIIWSGQYDTPMTAIFALEDLLCEEIGHALTNLSGKEQKQLARHETSSVAAYQSYAKGMYYWNQRTNDGYFKARDAFEQAIHEDPQFALAYVGLSNAYQFLGGYAIPREEAASKGKSYLLRSLQLDPNLAEAHASLGLYHATYEWDWPNTEKEYLRALQLKPNYAQVPHWYGEFLVMQGKFDEGIAELKRAVAIDPFSLNFNTDLGKCLSLARRYDEAVAQFKKTLELDPNYSPARIWLADCYMNHRMYPEAISEFHIYEKLDGSYLAHVAGAGIYAANGQQAEVKQMLAKLLEMSKHEPVSSAYFISVYLALRDKENTFYWMEKAFAEHSDALIGLKVSPYWDPLRSDPRFTHFLRRMNY